MTIRNDFITAFATGGIVDKADAGVTVIGNHTTHILRFSTTKREMQEWRDRLTEAVLSIKRSLPSDAHAALYGMEYNSPVDLTNPIVAAYYLGQLGMAEGMLANVLGHTVEDDVLERLMRPEMLSLLQHINAHPNQSFGEVARTLEVEPMDLKTMLDEAYVGGAIVHTMRGITWVYQLAPLGKQIVSDPQLAGGETNEGTR